MWARRPVRQWKCWSHRNSEFDFFLLFSCSLREKKTKQTVERLSRARACVCVCVRCVYSHENTIQGEARRRKNYLFIYCYILFIPRWGYCYMAVERFHLQGENAIQVRNVKRTYVSRRGDSKPQIFRLLCHSVHCAHNILNKWNVCRAVCVTLIIIHNLFSKAPWQLRVTYYSYPTDEDKKNCLCSTWYCTQRTHHRTIAHQIELEFE